MDESEFEWDQYWEKEKDRSLEWIIARSMWFVLTKRLLEPMNGVRSIKLLEAGSGSGSVAMGLIKNYGNIEWEVTLLDSSMGALSVANKLAVREGLEKNVKVFRGNILEMPFPDESFDIVMNEGTMDHFDTGIRQKAFSEMARITKAGGKLMVIVPNAFNPFYRMKKALHEYNGTWKYGFEKGYTYWELKRIFKSLHFTDIRTTGDSFLSDSKGLLGLVLAAVTGRQIMVAGRRSLFARIDGRLKIPGKIIKYLDLTLSKYCCRILARNVGIIGRKQS